MSRFPAKIHGMPDTQQQPAENAAVLLFYKFAPVSDPAAAREEHYQKARALGLKGRVYVAAEGLNGTVAGSLAAIAAYKSYVEAMPGFEDIHWKEELAASVPFAKLKVKLKPHLVSFGIANDVDPRQGGRHLEPAQWRQVLEEEKDVVLLDVRNHYESEIGHFENALRPKMEHFSEFPQWVQDLVPYKDKKILMYCTGGIRCEKFSALLVKEGFRNVNQLKGGILNYVKKEGTSHWRGRCFVFDDRLSVNTGATGAPLSECRHCHASEDRHVNCSNMECNELFVLCDQCAPRFEGACSEACQKAPGRRPFDPSTFRIPFRKKGVVFKELGLAESTRRKLGLG